MDHRQHSSFMKIAQRKGYLSMESDNKQANRIQKQEKWLIVVSLAVGIIMLLSFIRRFF